MLVNKGDVPSGWVSRLLVQCNVPYVEIWEVLHNMYESQVNTPRSLYYCPVDIGCRYLHSTSRPTFKRSQLR